ncbi:hypothetical protein [uncultured Lutibacter sp.]|uniref:hypothetical protein n=1 Tax=uncultured Lutibacter sp. TaxID=437739 RepID=UPI002639BB36|nr:hypothetical protein [uncultured Lutibacter sp.]
MNKKLKLIWDFKGSTSLKTAEHHCIHLKEFANIKKLHFYEINFIAISEMHSIAFITIDEKAMKIYRDALKPHRGQLA